MTMYKTLVMTILALVGVFCYHKKIVDQEMNKKLSELVLSLFTPVLLFTSFQKDFSKELVTGLMISVLLSAIAFFLIWCICKWVVRKLDKDYAVVELVALMYSNCGFIGIPMAQGIFGAEGVFYMIAYVAMANFLLWSHGVIVMSGKSDIKSLKKVFTSPTIISIILGIICFVAQIRVPQIIEEPMEMIANMNTPMAMMVAGINIAQAETSILSLQIILVKLCKADCDAICIGRSLLFCSSFTARKDYCDTGNSVSGRSDGKLICTSL